MAKEKPIPRQGNNLLLELGTEELPPKSLQLLRDSFASSLYRNLVDAEMISNLPGQYHAYATPRRLAILIEDVLSKQPDQVIHRRGPAIKVAFDQDGNPTPAAEGFARSCGVSIDSLETVETDKGMWLIYESTVKGKMLDTIVTDCLNKSVRTLPMPKCMRWGDCSHEFVRPVHWLLALHGKKLVRAEVLGLKSGRVTFGHRFHCPAPLKIHSADDYADTLKSKGFVIADFEIRRAMIAKQSRILAARYGLNAVIDPSLLDEVTGLVECPEALIGEFDRHFLELPEAILRETMASHQKYFHTTDMHGRLAPRFIAVSNLKSKSPKQVRAGNERVLRARLIDTDFFRQSDLKRKLEERIEDLSKVVFHHRLGSLRDRVHRIENLAGTISRQLSLDVEATTTAARLCKTDLVTDLVGEFPDLQGIVGRHYAVYEGLDHEIAEAIEGHYRPRFSGDSLPPGGIASSLALADRIDTLCGIFACGEIPTGEKDPFALRRAALGTLRILIEGKLDLDLVELIAEGMNNYRKKKLPEINTSAEVALTLEEFIMERLKGLLQSKGFSNDVWLAVRAVSPTNPLDFYNRTKAVHEFISQHKATADSLVVVNKRIANILVGIKLKGSAIFDETLAAVDSERELASMIAKLKETVCHDFQCGNYESGLEKLAGIRDTVDRFFDQVMVMADDLAVRNNRIILLKQIRSLYLDVADFSKIRTSR